MRLTRTAAPDGYALTPEEVSDHSIIETDEWDGVLSGFIAAVHTHLDGPSGILGRAILTQTWLLELEEWPDTIALPLEPLQSVVVTYFDTAGDEQTISSTDYVLAKAPKMRDVLTWRRGFSRPGLSVDAPYPVRFTMTAGFGGADDVPEDLKLGMKFLTAHWFEHREAVVIGQSANEMPMGASMLITPHRLLL